MTPIRLFKLWMIGAVAAPLAAANAQMAGADSVSGSRITNAGVIRASAATDSVFINRTLTIDTIDIGDFASYLMARIGAPPFDSSLNFRVTSDSSRIHIRGRLMDFPDYTRAELGPIFRFIDSTSVWVADISMPQAKYGVMVFRLERLSISGIAVPELLMLTALEKYRERYPEMLAAGGREFRVAIPLDAHVGLRHDAIVLSMPPPPGTGRP